MQYLVTEGQLKRPVFGAPASLIGSELPEHPSSGPSLCPVPMPQGVSYVHHTNLYIRNIIPAGVAIPSPAVLANRGGASPSFLGRIVAFTEKGSTWMC
jgi:hypothetical protein